MNTFLLIAIWCYYLDKLWDNLLAVFANDESVSVRLTLKIIMAKIYFVVLLFS